MEKFSNIDFKKNIGISISVLIGIVSELSIPNQSLLQKVLWMGLAIFGIYYFYTNVKKKKSIELFFLLSLLILPFILSVVHAFIINFNNDNLGIIKQAFTTSMYIVVDFLMVYFLIIFFKANAIYVLTNGIIFSYILGVLLSSFKYGFFATVISFFFNEAPISVYLENHDIGVAVVPILIYIVFNIVNKGKIEKKDISTIVPLIIILIACGKRSAYLAIIVSVLIGLGIYVFRKSTRKVCHIFLWITFSCAFLYIILLKENILTHIVNMLGINTMNRLHVYDWFNNQYNLSLLYFGKGFQYIHRYMVMGCGDYFVNNFRYLHNTILQLYIEYGFIGFTLWNLFELYIYPKLISYKLSNLVLYTILIISTYSMYAVDNVLTYPVYVVTFLLVLGSNILAKGNNEETGNEKNDFSIN